MTEEFQEHDDSETGAGRAPSVPAVTALLAGAVAASVAAVVLFRSCGEEPVVVTSPPAVPAVRPETAVPEPVVEMPQEEVVDAGAVEAPAAHFPEATAPQQETAPALPSLDESNELALRLLRDCIDHNLPTLPTDAGSLIRLFVVVVDNMAEGISPRPHLGFMGFRDSYPVRERDGRLYADPEGYRRYDDFALLAAGLDAGACAAAYGSLRPLVEEAYGDLGYPDRSFDETLVRAIGRITDLEIPQGEVMLLRGEGTYHYEDPALEKLGSLERQIIRMGPENGGAVQRSLRAFAAALRLN